ncbi:MULTISPECIES: TerC family protein [Rhodomicrobium]|uniref:TerC family protein n=1 Tax=Rhodomicrobium TaxID=1068 RepID=UPI000B4A7939|nr:MULTISPECIES: TerC family protein [Rhodomicrobium]
MIDLLDPASWGAAFDAVWLDMHRPTFWVGVLQIIWINILLSGDNAVVIALACRSLPARQRMWGMLLGAGVAILMRVVFTLIISTLMALPFLKLAGGLALFFIAVKLLLPEEEETHVESSAKLWSAVRIVALADLVMSLDNVIAIAAAAKGNVALFVFGLALSIPLIIVGAALVMSLLTRFPILVWAGAGLLGWIAGELIVTDPGLHGILAEAMGSEALHSLHYVAAAAGAAIVIGVGYMLRRRRVSAAT